MNYETKKSVIKATIIFLTIIFVSSFISSLYSIISNQTQSLLQSYGINLEYLSLITPIVLFLSTIYFCFSVIYLNKKLKQTKEEFYSKTKAFKTFAIVSIILNIGIGVLIAFVAFTKDYKEPQNITFVTPKIKLKPKIYLDKDTKKQIRILKHQKRHGEISKENYQKQYNQLIKKQKQLG